MWPSDTRFFVTNRPLQALRKATGEKEWNVDIIVMPFSVNGDRDAVESAINDAAHRGKILIASAANFGAPPVSLNRPDTARS